MSKYAMSDLHGCYDKFIAMLELIKFTDEDQLYILGDVVDRGNKPFAILQYIIDKPNIELLLGNHEDMLLDYANLRDEGNLSIWFGNGGQITYKQLFMEADARERVRILNYLRERPLYKIVDNFILVHSGIAISPNMRTLSVEQIMEEQERETLLWSREEFYEYEAIKGYTVIFGHTPTKYLHQLTNKVVSYPLTIWHNTEFKDKICIDCGAVFSKEGQLSCLRLNDMEEYYI